MAVPGFGGPSGFPLDFSCGGVQEGFSALLWQQGDDLGRHELGVSWVGDADDAVGAGGAHVAVRAGKTHVREWR